MRTCFWRLLGATDAINDILNIQAKKRAAFLKRHLGVSLELNEFEQVCDGPACLSTPPSAMLMCCCPHAKNVVTYIYIIF